MLGKIEDKRRREKEMATYSSVLAWRIPGMGEPGGLLSMGSHRVGHTAPSCGFLDYLGCRQVCLPPPPSPHTHTGLTSPLPAVGNLLSCTG